MNATPSVLIAGPTASGKSALALEIAARAPSVIINADALQVYGLWRVLTARPSAEEEAQAPHRLYGHVAPGVAYSAGAWLRDLAPVLEEAIQKGLRPIVIGGTGLYFSALTSGLAEIPPIPPDIRKQADELRALGPSGFATLERDDPEIWARIDRQNPMRLQRAWEVYQATGKPLSAWQAETGAPVVDPNSAICVCVDVDRDWLAARIEKRFDLMLEGGALEECEAWIAAGHPMTLPAAKALGAPELIDYIKGNITLDLAREKAIVATRQFAKRQRTWFRSKMRDWRHIDPANSSLSNTAREILGQSPLKPPQ